MNIRTWTERMMSENGFCEPEAVYMQAEINELKAELAIWIRRADKTWYEKVYTDEIATLKAKLAALEAIADSDDGAGGEGMKLFLENRSMKAELAALRAQEPVARFNWHLGKFEWLTKYNFAAHNMKPLFLAAADSTFNDKNAEYWNKLAVGRWQENQKLEAKLAAAETSANELRRAVAELIGADPETWPNHGNAPLAIAAYVAVQQAELAAQTKAADHWMEEACKNHNDLVRANEKLATFLAQEPAAWLYEVNGRIKLEPKRLDNYYWRGEGDSWVKGKPLILVEGAAPVPRMTGAALASQEPVAEVLLVDGEKVIDASMAFFDSVELGTKLYLAAGAAPKDCGCADQRDCDGTCCKAAPAPVQQDDPTHPQFIAGFKSGSYSARRRMDLHPEKYPDISFGEVICPECDHKFVAYTAAPVQQEPVAQVETDWRNGMERVDWKFKPGAFTRFPTGTYDLYAAPVQHVFGGRVDPSYVSGPMEEASAAKVPEEPRIDINDLSGMIAAVIKEQP